MNSYEVLAIAIRPEALLTIGTLLIIMYDLIVGKRMTQGQRQTGAMIIGLVTLASAFVQAVGTGIWKQTIFYDSFMLDELTLAARGAILVLSALTLLVYGGSARAKHSPEFVGILLLATAGFTLMASAANLLVAFLGLELASLSLYILAGFDKSSPSSAEAGLKYFLFGGMAAAFVLFGFSLIYGLTGSIGFHDISYVISRQGMNPLLLVALVMVVVGLGYKAAAAPFHLWAPDVYQGAPAPAAALIASASKLAGLVLFIRLLHDGLGSAEGDFASMRAGYGWAPVIAILAVASMLLGNIAALAQSNLRRLLAYSAIAHAGNMLLGILVYHGSGPGPVLYYVFTYGLATIGIFGVISVIERDGPCQKITDLAGLWKRSPFLSLCLFVYVLSLAGVPPLAGFFGKFYVFAEAFQKNGLGGYMGWLAILAIALSAVGLYYYLVILKQALVANPSDDAKASRPISVPFATGLALVISLALVVACGLFPSVLLQLFER